MKCAVVTGAGSHRLAYVAGMFERMHPSMPGRTTRLLGATIGAAMLALLAVAPAHRPAGPANVPELVPWRPSVQARFASALRALGEEPRATGFTAGTLVAVVRPVEP